MLARAGRGRRYRFRHGGIAPGPPSAYFPAMTKLEKLERQIKALTPDEVRRLGAFVDELRAELWDAQMEADVKAGKLDELAEQALADHAAGRTRPLPGQP
jgi:hypothetical protein